MTNSEPQQTCSAVMPPFAADGDGPFARALAMADVQLLPGTVVAIVGGHPVLDIGCCEVRAELALAIDYEPEMGDQLLAIGQRGDWWVIGILTGHGKRGLMSDGDISINSLCGSVRIAGQQSVEVRTQKMTLITSTLHRIAEVVHDSFGKLFHHVRGLRCVQAGQSDTRVEGVRMVRSERSVERSEKETKITGSTLHLG